MTVARQLTINNEIATVESPDDEPLLWVLRDRLNLVGTRFGCGEGECGACTVLIGGRPVTSCSIRVGDVSEPVTTVEGLASPDGTLHRLQQTILDLQAGQCGYCISGILMRAAALIERLGADLTEADVRLELDAHLCRCGDHTRIVAAVLQAASIKQ
ncbi:unannotated protein [freshwater metagenome]|uniref:Unannotated protein n=1 Tax=freshwater metagenome TaxID=449393 RepID=A0A6J7I4K7_9ZZZZ